MKKILTVLFTLAAIGLGSKVWAYSWKDWIETTEGGLVEFTALKSVAPSYFYNAFAGRSEAGATTEVLQIGKFVSADVGYSVPNVQDGNQGTVILGGNFHIDRLVADAFPKYTEVIKSFIPEPAKNFWQALTIGVYIGHDTINRELAGGVYSGLEFRF